MTAAISPTTKRIHAICVAAPAIPDKSEYSGDDCDDQKRNCPVQHGLHPQEVMSVEPTECSTIPRRNKHYADTVNGVGALLPFHRLVSAQRPPPCGVGRS